MIRLCFSRLIGELPRHTLKCVCVCVCLGKAKKKKKKRKERQGDCYDYRHRCFGEKKKKERKNGINRHEACVFGYLSHENGFYRLQRAKTKKKKTQKFFLYHYRFSKPTAVLGLYSRSRCFFSIRSCKSLARQDSKASPMIWA